VPYGQLRAVHLRTHLATRASLTEIQRAKYQTLRGYDANGEMGTQGIVRKASSVAGDDSIDVARLYDGFYSASWRGPARRRTAIPPLPSWRSCSKRRGRSG
jgi:hypothetical protein